MPGHTLPPDFYPGPRPPPRYRTLDSSAVAFATDLIYSESTQGWAPIPKELAGHPAMAYTRMISRHEKNFIKLIPEGYAIQTGEPELTDLVYMAEPQRKYWITVRSFYSIYGNKTHMNLRIRKITETVTVPETAESQNQTPKPNYGLW